MFIGTLSLPIVVCADIQQPGRGESDLETRTLLSGSVPSISYRLMRINRVIGFGLFIVLLKVLMGEVFQGLETTLLKFFAMTGKIMDATQAGVGNL